MDALSLIKRQIRHRKIDSDDGHYLKHLVSNKIQERSSALALDVTQRDEPDLLPFVPVKKRQLKARVIHVDLCVVLEELPLVFN